MPILADLTKAVRRRQGFVSLVSRFWFFDASAQRTKKHILSSSRQLAFTVVARANAYSDAVNSLCAPFRTTATSESVSIGSSACGTQCRSRTSLLAFGYSFGQGTSHCAPSLQARDAVLSLARSPT